MTDPIDDLMTEQDAKEFLKLISGRFGISIKARSPETILQNIDNSIRRSACLSRIEDYHSQIEQDENGDDVESSLLNWGEDPEQYIETYKAVIGDSKVTA